MTSYQTFIGIDIGKFSFVINMLNSNQTKTYANTEAGIGEFFDDYGPFLKHSLCVLENTGGYEIDLLYALSSAEIAVHRADGCKVKNFIRSYGAKAKTDALDAKALARYGFERYQHLNLFVPQSQKMLELHQLIRRKQDLKAMGAAEKNRFQAPGLKIVKDSCKDLIILIDAQIRAIEEKIQKVIAADPLLKNKQKILKSVPGIGTATANALMILLPELGQLNRKHIASLAGLAPKANDSGTFKGYRKTGKGRTGIKALLFMSAMAASRTKSILGIFYKRLLAHGKKKMVALTAVMRKIILIANARLKEFYNA